MGSYPPSKPPGQTPTPATKPGRTAGQGIPLDRLREHERSLRLQAQAEAQAARTPEPGAPEEAITQETTGRVARAALDQAQGAAPVALEAALDRLADRISSRVVRETHQPVPDLRKGVFHEWSRFFLGALGAIALVLGAWWSLANMMRDRPILGDVKEIVAPMNQQLEAQDNEQRAQRDVLIEVSGSLRTLDATLKEVKADLKEDAKASKGTKRGR